MSIINEALKKADYLKKWKKSAQKQPAFESSPANTPVAVDEVAPQSQPIPKPTVISHAAPLTFQPRTVFEKKKSVVFDWWISKLIPWVVAPAILSLFTFFAWKAFQLNPASEKFSSSINDIEPTTVIMPTKVSPPAKKTQYAPYRSAGPQVSVRPVPKTIQNHDSFFHLTGTSILNDNQKYAFINRKMVELGGTIHGAEVIAIEEKKVVLRRNGHDFVLTLEEID